MMRMANIKFKRTITMIDGMSGQTPQVRGSGTRAGASARRPDPLEPTGGFYNWSNKKVLWRLAGLHGFGRDRITICAAPGHLRGEIPLLAARFHRDGHALCEVWQRIDISTVPGQVSPIATKDVLRT